MGNSGSSHPQHGGGDNFDCCTERYGIVEYYLPFDEQKPLNMYFGKQ